MMFLFCSLKRWLRSGGFMQDVSAPLADSVRLVFHSDDNTPVEFIVSLLQTVFAKSERDARLIVAQLNEQGASACGPYPAAVAKALLDECERRIREAGHPQRVTGEEPRTCLTNSRIGLSPMLRSA
jgi:ATP-dependent Clp protease adapter protein ClpS